MCNHIPTTEVQFTKLIEFRQAAYECLGKAWDAQFELTDAVILTPAANSFANCPCRRSSGVSGPVSMRRFKTDNPTGKA